MHTRTHVRMYTISTHMHIHILNVWVYHAYTCTHACTHARTHSHARTYTHARTHAHTHTCMHARMHTNQQADHECPSDNIARGNSLSTGCSSTRTPLVCGMGARMPWLCRDTRSRKTWRSGLMWHERLGTATDKRVATHRRTTGEINGVDKNCALRKKTAGCNCTLFLSLEKLCHANTSLWQMWLPHTKEPVLPKAVLILEEKV